MHLSRSAFLIRVLAVISVQRNGSGNEIPDLRIQEGKIVTCHFDVPQKIVMDEIYRRTTGDKMCDLDIHEVLMKEDTKWTFSIVVGEVSPSPKDSKMEPYRYLIMTFHGANVSLGLAFFSTHIVEQNALDFSVDSITWENGVITVKRGHDNLVLNIELDEDCQQYLEGRKQNNLTVPSLTSWYPHSIHLSDCIGNEWPDSNCEQLVKDHCSLQSVDNDVCFKSDHDGHSCPMTMKIRFMTGIFREKSLGMADTPLKSVSGYYFKGLRRTGIVYPCLYSPN